MVYKAKFIGHFCFKSNDLEYYIMQYLILILVYCVKYYIYLKKWRRKC